MPYKTTKYPKSNVLFPILDVNSTRQQIGGGPTRPLRNVPTGGIARRPRHVATATQRRARSRLRAEATSSRQRNLR